MFQISLEKVLLLQVNTDRDLVKNTNTQSVVYFFCYKIQMLGKNLTNSCEMFDIKKESMYDNKKQTPYPGAGGEYIYE